jgi:predicted alpha/beta superfamily hydrolase
MVLKYPEIFGKTGVFSPSFGSPKFILWNNQKDKSKNLFSLR